MKNGKIFFKILALFSSFAVLLSAFSGCGKNPNDAVIYFELQSIPSSVDPQTAFSDDELLLVRNLFEGLLRIDRDGKTVCGAAEKYSKDGLVYTFNLRKDAKWSDKKGTPVTVDDFVFAFKRALDRKTEAPFVSRLFCIENAEKIYNGQAAFSDLGVWAEDDYTLKIKLAFENTDFENTLTTSVAMPCNEKIFNSAEGKYGLSSETVISNGSYILYGWNKEKNVIRLYKNEKYNGGFIAKNAAVYITKDAKKTELVRLKDNSVDLAFIDSSFEKTVKDAGLKTVDFENILWVMTVSPRLSAGLRKTLAMLTGPEIFEKSLQSGYRPAKSIFPNVLIKNPPQTGIIEYDKENAVKLFGNEIDSLPDKKFPSGIKLHYYDNGVIKPVITDIVGHWQNNIGAFVNIQATDDLNELEKQTTEQTYDIAVFPIYAKGQDLSEYLRKFGIEYNGEDLADVQQILLKSANIIPLAYQKTQIAYSPVLSNLFTEPSNGYIDFSFAQKDN